MSNISLHQQHQLQIPVVWILQSKILTDLFLFQKNIEHCGKPPLYKSHNKSYHSLQYANVVLDVDHVLSLNFNHL